MNLQASLMQNSDAKNINVFATRFARKCFLEHYCPQDHPILTIERTLVEDARAKMTNGLSIIYPKNTFHKIRSVVVKMIISVVNRKIQNEVDDLEIQENILNRAKNELLILFPRVH